MSIGHEMNMALSTSTTLFSILPIKNANYSPSNFQLKQAQTSVNGFFPSYKTPNKLESSYHRSPLTVSAISSSQVGSLAANETNMSMLDKALVFDLKGNGIPITDLWNDRKAVVAFARHFGCVLCRKRADYLASKKRSSRCDTIRFAAPKTRSIITDRFSVSPTQTRTVNCSSTFPCRSLPEAEIQPAITSSLPVKIVSIFENGSISPLQSAPWQDVLLHTEQMDTAAVTLVIIGPGSVDQAKSFCEQTKFKGEVYADPNHSSYDALRFVSGVSTTFTPKAALKIFELYIEGYRQDWGLSFQKDTVSKGGWQQGGIIVAGPGKSNISYIHKDKEAGDDPPIEDILKACCS